MDNDREIFVESVFEEGDYAIYVENEWSQNFVRDMVISCYGENGTAFLETEMSPNTLD